MADITSIPVPAKPARGRKRWLFAGLAAALAVCLGQVPAAAALDIKQVGDHYEITVNDLLADPSVYQAELRARGIDITLSLAPTSPARAGAILVMNDLDRVRGPVEGGVTTIDGPGPCVRFGGCPVGLRVPVGFDRKAEIVLGREGRPGERYTMPPGIGMTGEPLHCVVFSNKTVAEIGPMLRDRGLEPEFTAYGVKGLFTPPQNWYVHDGVVSQAGGALLLVDAKPLATPKPLDASC